MKYEVRSNVTLPEQNLNNEQIHSIRSVVTHPIRKVDNH